MRWKELTTAEQFSRLLQDSNHFPVIIFKHSTRCGTSRVAMSRVERYFKDDSGEFEFYYLDLLSHRSLSNDIAGYLQVRHESPQLLMIRNGKCIYHASHLFISMDTALKRGKEAA